MFIDFEVKDAQDFATYVFEDPRDERRYFEKRCDIINCGDSFGQLNSYMEAVEANWNEFCLFGSICEPYETMWVLGNEGLLDGILPCFREKLRILPIIAPILC